MTLVDFLLARIAEDEQAARAVAPLAVDHVMGGRALPQSWSVDRLSHASADGYPAHALDKQATEHFDRGDPSRVLAECAAKRSIIEQLWTGLDRDEDDYVLQMELLAGRWQGATDEIHTGLVWAASLAMQALAQPYADHPDFDAAWRPA